MAIKTKLHLTFFVLFLFFVSATLSLAEEREDRGLQSCKQVCRAQSQLDESQRVKCEEVCEYLHRQKQGRERGQGERGGSDFFINTEVPDKRDLSAFKECLEQCQQQQPGQQQRGERMGEKELTPCQQRCVEQLQRQGSGGERFPRESQQEQGYDVRRPGRREGDPYVFHNERFRGEITSEHGNMKVLEKFTQRSDLLQGIENYRMVFTQVKPNVFMVPNHWDADGICFVIRGNGSITLLQQDNKETFNIQAGDAFRIRAGTTSHFLNSHNNEQLYIAELVIPVNTPGSFEAFYAPGGRDIESFFNAFSDNIMRAAFNTEVDQVRKLFRGENKGAFVEASRRQIEAITSQSSEGGIWPFHRGGQTQTRPINLMKQDPTQSNNYGRLFEVNPNDYRPFQDLDVGISVAELNKGAMTGPYYNSRATKIAFVAEGSARIEIACPHLSQQQGQGQHQRGERQSERGSTSYQKVSAQVSAGDVFVVPAGHPVVSVASDNENVRMVCFEVNAQNNQKYQLAGKNNVLRQLEDAAKELSFNVPAKQVDEVFDKQRESWFFPGPNQRQQQGGRAEA